jgi:Hypothetical glycosyl hydrolase 6
MSQQPWYQGSIRRNLVDMHIEDWDERFLSRFDPRAYVAMLKKAHVQGAMVYANSHVGYCYWPTPVGKMHSGIKGKDTLGEVISQCRKEGMDVIVYYTLIYDNWAYDHDHSWRVIDVDGKPSREKTVRGEISSGRYGVCCPNSAGYREYTRAQLADLAGRYDFQGVFLDMTFWPTVCYCPSCREKYAAEVGGPMPMTIDWHDETWVAFQKKREEWLSDFAQFATRCVKSGRPEATVDHQFSTSLHPWLRGSTDAIAAASDYCGGDFYGGFFQQSFICKLFYNLTRNRPFEYHTSRCYPNLQDHTTMKTREMLEIHASITIAHAGAFLFIDAIDPVGTLNPKVYELLGGVFDTMKAYDPYFGGDLCQEIAVYFSLTSKMDFADNGKRPGPCSESFPHMDAALGAARKLKAAHLPFGIVSRRNLADLSSFKALVLPDVMFLDAEEKAALASYVREGGNLYVSGSRAGRILSDLVGITVLGETDDILSYIAPSRNDSALLPGVEKEYPLTIFGRQCLARAEPGTEVLATVTLPYTDSSDTAHFASIHSDPPGRPTDNAAIVLRSHGKGHVLWCSHPIEKAEQPPHKRCFTAMVRSLAGDDPAFGLDGPPAVEMTAFHQADRKRFVLHFVNMQEELPPVTARAMRASLRSNGLKWKRAVSVPDGAVLTIHSGKDRVEVDVPPLDIYRMIALEYE